MVDDWRELLRSTRISFMGWLCWMIVYLNRNWTEVICVDTGNGLEPYLLRSHLVYQRWFFPGIYLHFFFKGDQDRDLHNHPWNAYTLVLSGGYSEEYLTLGNAMARRDVRAGQINQITNKHFHRVDLFEKGCWTLFFVGKRTQSWGFLNRDTFEFVDYKVYRETGGRYPLLPHRNIDTIVKGS